MPLVSRTALSLLVTCSLLANATGAWAANPVSPPLPPSGAPAANPPVSNPAAASTGNVVAAPDVVRLKSGGMLRGTISELVPGGDVVLITATGEVRRIALSDVEYAGPADAAPSAPVAAAPAPSAPPPAAPAYNAAATPVEFVSSTPELMVHDRSGISTGIVTGYRGSAQVRLSEFRDLCIAPCKATLPAGGHTLAVSIDGGRIIEAHKPITIDGPAKININYESRKDARIAGIVVMAVGYAEAIAAPIVLFATRDDCSSKLNTSTYNSSSVNSFQACEDNNTSITTALVASGLGLLVGTVGLIVALVNKDTVSFEQATPDSVSRVRDTLDRNDGKHSNQASFHFTRSGIGLTF